VPISTSWARDITGRMTKIVRLIANILLANASSFLSHPRKNKLSHPFFITDPLEIANVLGEKHL
jgi:hypothetical protein